MASAGGALLGGCVDTWNEGGWVEQPIGSKPATALITDKVLEIRVPWRMLGVEPGGKSACVGFTMLNRRADWRAAPETWTEVEGTVMEVPK